MYIYFRCLLLFCFTHWLTQCFSKLQDNEEIEYPKNCTKLKTETSTFTKYITIDENYSACYWRLFPPWWICTIKKRSKRITKLYTRHAYREVYTCCEGYLEAINGSCIPGCASGFYGEQCDKNCSCPENAYANCDKTSGNCTCLPGLTGDSCTEVCRDGYFGVGCKFKCLCENNSTCNHQNGFCNCTTPGYTGQFCQSFCDADRYGPNCDLHCSCLLSQICDPKDGHCTCKAGKTGPNCTEDCPYLTYGPNCSSACRCNKQHTENCKSEDGSCLCKPGWEGTFCGTSCGESRYGQNCSLDCNCKKDLFCEPEYGMCIPNCLCYSKGTLNCDNKTPLCHCQRNLTDNVCSVANVTSVPSIETFMRTICDCREDDTFCKPQNDTCSCKEGWKGDQCQDHITTSSPQSSTSSTISRGSIVAIVLTIAVVAIGGAALYKCRGKKGSGSIKSQTGKHFTNAAYSNETTNVICNDSKGNQPTKIEGRNEEENQCPGTNVNDTEYKDTEEYHHIEFKKDRSADTSTAIYSHLAENTKSTTGDVELYDSTSHGRQTFDDYTSNTYGIVRQAKSSDDDTYDATVH